MRVYVVLGNAWEESSTLLGVYRARDAAIARACEFADEAGERRFPAGVTVESVVLDAPSDGFPGEYDSTAH